MKFIAAIVISFTIGVTGLAVLDENEMNESLKLTLPKILYIEKHMGPTLKNLSRCFEQDADNINNTICKNSRKIFEDLLNMFRTLDFTNKTDLKNGDRERDATRQVNTGTTVYRAEDSDDEEGTDEEVMKARPSSGFWAHVWCFFKAFKDFVKCADKRHDDSRRAQFRFKFIKVTREPQVEIIDEYNDPDERPMMKCFTYGHQSFESCVSGRPTRRPFKLHRPLRPLRPKLLPKLIKKPWIFNPSYL